MEWKVSGSTDSVSLGLEAGVRGAFLYPWFFLSFFLAFAHQRRATVSFLRETAVSGGLRSSAAPSVSFRFCFIPTRVVMHVNSSPTSPSSVSVFALRALFICSRLAKLFSDETKIEWQSCSGHYGQRGVRVHDNSERRTANNCLYEVLTFLFLRVTTSSRLQWR